MIREKQNVNKLNSDNKNKEIKKESRLEGLFNQFLKENSELAYKHEITSIRDNSLDSFLEKIISADLKLRRQFRDLPNSIGKVSFSYIKDASGELRVTDGSVSLNLLNNSSNEEEFKETLSVSDSVTERVVLTSIIIDNKPYIKYLNSAINKLVDLSKFDNWFDTGKIFSSFQY